MKSSWPNKLSERIQRLYSTMLTLMPLERIGDHPFDYFDSEIECIIESVDAVFKSILSRRLKMEKEIDGVMERIKKDCGDIEVEAPYVPRLFNLCLLREYVKNESNRITLLKKAVEGRMITIREEIEKIKEDIFDVETMEIDCIELKTMDEESCVSLANLKELEMRRDFLRSKKEGMERNRDRLYEELCVFLSQLSKNDLDVAIGQKIFVLEQLHKKYKEEIERRDLEFRRLEIEIRRREGYLGTPCKEIEMDLSDENLGMMRSYEKYLREEQERQLDEIYEKKRSQLKELLDIFGENMEDYKKTEEGIEEMAMTISKLESKKDLFLSIRSLMEKRSELISKMSEFEKIASDPKRLFRSSLQLLSEEKFRNSAYPNLIRIEEAIFKLLDEYEDRFEKLLKNGIDFKKSLREEIENRIVNKTVFISRFDSPSRKRR
ncbi:hypothetical protein EROM_050410 [Encephalitozoon romaleae SJ-2008]|uniref:Uncharacterized protein n=1 Tax=Encephalitozoon romaleae (strain SJ-2008) TaxID=1178016 RepID=I7AMM5_ENCRO|nr:hypothetical protein EROM_050410 [Encephalitozoon romaleae SJ-2008]AFN82974.1 hypothetical protein EROM_050410 [Encephalitozoon romaleae SJ-2008]